MVEPVHRFDRDTALVPTFAHEEDGASVQAFDARIDDGWWIVAGPNGGYLNAILLRGMIDAVGDSARSPRTQTTHFTARAQPGPAQVRVRIERQGRSLSTVTARLEQEGRLIAYSLAALGTARRTEAASFQDVRMPEVPAPAELEVAAALTSTGNAFAFGERYEKRPAFGPRQPSVDAEATTGGWIRPASARCCDALLLSALADAWPPAIFHKVPPGPAGQGVPTVELTVHFRAPALAASVPPDAYFLVRFHTRTSRDGFVEEDGEIWSPEGVLLAQSRQLALLA